MLVAVVLRGSLRSHLSMTVMELSAPSQLSLRAKRSNPLCRLRRQWIATALRASQRRGEFLIQLSNSDEDAGPHSRDVNRPRFTYRSALSSNRGRRESRVPIAPVGPVQQKAPEVGPQVKPEQSGFPCAMVLRFLSCSPRRDRYPIHTFSSLRVV
ncbi:hypothetical protein ACFFWD_16915, partial [Bradyrhizobium erythrophlei]|uniref:hypothetical protein n=1 Tax=Bradyrhizobium erythrophlei TaxID=1437360 RepID=UPI0035EA46E1